MRAKSIAVVVAAVFGLGVGAAYALSGEDRIPVEFFVGHTHTEDGGTHGAPEHSGGTDRNGCHNASVPYHCH